MAQPDPIPHRRFPAIPRLGWASIGVSTVILIGAGSAVAVTTSGDADTTTASAELLTDSSTNGQSSGPRIPLMPSGDPAAAIAPEAAVAPPPPAAVAVAVAEPKSKKADATPQAAVAAQTIPSQQRILNLVNKHFPANEVGHAMAVAQCESGQANRIGSTNQNGTTDFGVFQLNNGGTLQTGLRMIGHPFGSMTDAENAALREDVNVRAAAAIWRSRGGWGPWVCASNLGIVKSLYTNEKGPAYGTFSAVGNPGLTLPAADTVSKPPKKPTKKPTKKPAKTPSKAPTKTPSKTPSQSPTATPPSQPTPEQSDSHTASPDSAATP